MAVREVEDELESDERIVGPGQGELLPQIVKHFGVILLLRLLLLLLPVIAGSLCDVEKQIEAGIAVRLKNLVILVIFLLQNLHVHVDSSSRRNQIGSSHCSSSSSCPHLVGVVRTRRFRAALVGTAAVVKHPCSGGGRSSGGFLI
ncbi:hypothetical protein DVH24_005030 [Malus domestica]|uniref:Uncharacterized protein n=1 Tax=Malus domestica TaxID=3750 RepID=A0A498ICC2_MALDO|nr:hypothetical protein DVH24_005030 [Malus domestica]